jgi:hypothetical protein
MAKSSAEGLNGDSHDSDYHFLDNGQTEIEEAKGG